MRTPNMHSMPSIQASTRPINHQMRHQLRAAFVAAPAPAPTAEASAPALLAVGSHEAHAVAPLVSALVCAVEAPEVPGGGGR